MREKKNRSHFLPSFIALVVFLSAPLFSQAENGISGFFHEQLENGLDVYFLEDYSAPSASFCFVVKAGTAVQTSASTGIAELCARLFFSPSGGQQFFYDNGAFSINSECSGDYALYSSVFSADSVRDILSGLSACVITDEVPTDEFEAQYSLMKKKAEEWESSSESYINGTMDGVMFPSYPWSRETGLCPETFVSAGVDGVMDMVMDMRRTYYVPDNSALFLCGPFSPDYMFSLVESLFAEWNYGKTVPLKSVYEEGDCSLADLMSWDEAVATSVRQELHALRLGSRRSGGGRFVLTSSSFSKEFNQLIVQYVMDGHFFTAAEVAAATTAEALFENGSSFKAIVLEDENCGIKSADWLYTSLLRQQSGMRLVFQAIAENNGTSPGTQALAFLRCIESANVFSDDEISYFSRITADRLSLLRRDSFQFIHAMAEDWAFCNPVFPELPFSFSKSFFEPFTVPQASAALALSSDDLFRVLDSEPYVFLLLNDEVYAQYSDSLAEDGFVYVPQDDGVWYKTDAGKLALGGSSSAASFSGLVIEKCSPLLVSELSGLVVPEPEMAAVSEVSEPCAETEVTEVSELCAETEEASVSLENLEPPPSSYSGVQNYIDYGKSSFISVKLTNGIPVLVQNGDSSAFSFRIMFSGKKEVLSASERDLRLVITDVIANNIRQYILMSGAVPYSEFSVTTENTSYGTSIEISTTSEYAEPVLSIAAEALFFGEISAPRVDECAYSRSSEWGMKLSDGDFQLHAAAMQSLCKDNSTAGYFDLSTDFFSGLVFQDIEMEYLEMLDASCVSLALCGNDASGFVPLVENLFGFLMSFSSSARDSSVLGSEQLVSDDQVSVVLHRIFTSSVKPGEYVAQPDKLIPTEVFYDPLHIYFQCPALTSPEYAVFAALVYELEEILDGMWDGGVLSSFDCLHAPVAGIWFNGVTCAADVYDVFAKGIEVLQRPFDDERIKALRSRYVGRFCDGVESASSCTSRLFEGYFYAGDGTLYINQLEAIKNATSEDFEAVASGFSSMPLLRAVSADTK